MSLTHVLSTKWLQRQRDVYYVGQEASLFWYHIWVCEHVLKTKRVKTTLS